MKEFAEKSYRIVPSHVLTIITRAKSTVNIKC